MSTTAWIIAAIIAVPLLWFGLKIIASIAFSPEYSGRALLKQAAKKRGVDISRIPDSAWDEIVKSKINAAKGIANFSGNPDDKNWRANLVRQLESEATIVAMILAGESPLAGGPTKDILGRHGVIKV